MENVTYDLRKMEKTVKKYIDKDRFEHTQGVRYTCAALAMKYGCSVTDAQVAGLLHDCAKNIPNDKKIKLCRKHHLSVSKFELESPYLLHAKLGAWVAAQKYNVSNVEILSAITYHTTGKPEMSTLEKIVFIADYIEPKRDKAAHLDEIRRTAFEDMDECIYLITKDTLEYLKANPKSIDDMTQHAYDYYKNLHEKKELQEVI